MKDDIFSRPQQRIAPFTFDERVASVFDDMISRSVPGYRAIIDHIPLLAEQCAQAETHCYDVGCSLGAGCIALDQGLQHAGIHAQVIGIDPATAMVQHARENCSQRVRIEQADARSFVFTNASIILCNFALQFIAPEERYQLLDKLYASLIPGGVLMLSEKISSTSTRGDSLLQSWHENFKSAQGYSDLEIAQKRSAIDNVLIRGIA